MKKEHPKYTASEMAAARSESYNDGFSDGKQYVWDALAEQRDLALCAAFVVGVLCCVAYTLSSITYWLFS
jgi:hypothetical protein